MSESLLDHAPAIYSASSVEEAAIVCNRMFYPHRLSPLARSDSLSMRLAAWRLGCVTIGDVAYGADVSVRPDGGELHAYHVNVPLTGRLESRYKREEISASPTCCPL
ncbi:hypothetical protein [Mycobacterium paraintracellulare]|uniref:AraC-like ligand-binding domain-containing protein n=1 Tax=Mycobacterium paraintracellulare TaxID=1138383 RepID=UPI001926F604|nr:hypothetical protein [Mycobacterium paraintracellulare]BCP14188.1 hypothetical protein MINTM021_10970 [Mycobacterium paraintracellulare]